MLVYCALVGLLWALGATVFVVDLHPPPVHTAGGILFLLVFWPALVAWRLTFSLHRLGLSGSLLVVAALVGPCAGTLGGVAAVLVLRAGLGTAMD